VAVFVLRIFSGLAENDMLEQQAYEHPEQQAVAEQKADEGWQALPENGRYAGTGRSPWFRSSPA